MATTEFKFGDIIRNTEDNTKWIFKGYLIDKITVSAQWANENSWQGSQGSKTFLRAVPVDDKQAEPTERLLASLFVKDEE
jgi:hypothetical protein